MKNIVNLIKIRLYNLEGVIKQHKYCIENNISFIPYGPLAFGLLGGGFTKDSKLDEQDWRNSIPLFQGDQFQQTLTKVDKLKEFAFMDSKKDSPAVESSTAPTGTPDDLPF